MIKDILSRHPEGGFEKVLELIISSELSAEKKYTDYFEVKIDAEFYIDQLCGSTFYNANTGEERWSDGLREIFSDLRNLGVIESYIMRPYTKADRAEYDTADLMADLYFNEETGSPIDDAPWDQGALYLENGGPYYVKCDKEKVKLFRDIIFKRRKFICKIGTIKYLIPYFTDFDLESFIDWIELDQRYVFHDMEVLLFAIASSKRLHLAKTYHYLSRHIPDEHWDNFVRGPLDFENEVVSSRNTNFDEIEHKDGFGNFFFNSEKDNEFAPKNKQDLLIAGTVSYDPSTKQMKIGDKYVSFKTAPKQATFIEYLIENRDRSISSTEISKIGIIDIKRSIDDIKKKMTERGVSRKQRKDIFHYFEDEGVKYCRILL